MIDKIVRKLKRFILKNSVIGIFVFRNIPANVLKNISYFYAKKTFKRALNINAYRDFIEKVEGVSKNMLVKDFNKIPIIDKDSYIKKYSIFDRSYPVNPAFFYRSSGYSGEPIFWSQSKDEILDFFHYVDFNMQSIFQINRKKTLIISLFALSSWVTGQEVLSALNYIALRNKHVTYFASNMDYKEGIEMVEKVGKDFEQIIVMSYPITLKTFVEDLKERTEESILKKIRIVVGAEGVTYEWCKYIENLLGKEKSLGHVVYSAFGAADIGIGFGAEQDFSLYLKDRLYENKELRKSLLGSLEMPLHIFQYDPTSVYVENVNGDFVVTIDKQVPLVRYNLHDSIKSFTFEEIKKKMKALGINIKQETRGMNIMKLPFLAVYGRSDDTIILNGANIYVNSFKEALQKEEIVKYHTGKFRVHVVEDEKLFQNFKVEIELRDNIKESPELKVKIREHIVSFLLNHDKGYKDAYHNPYASDRACIIEFVKFNETSIKHKYV